MSENSEKTVLQLRPFWFFYRSMLISDDTQFSTHVDVKIDKEDMAGYIQLTVCIMHQNFPSGVIQEKFVWDVTRSDLSVWDFSERELKQIEKLSGDQYDTKIRRRETRVRSWYGNRIEKIEPLMHRLLMEMFISGDMTVNGIDMLVQERYRPQGGAEMIACLPWDDKDDDRQV